MNSRLERLHKASLYAVLLVAFFAMFTGGTLWAVTGAIFPAALAGCWFVDRAGWGDDSYRSWWNALILAAFGVTAGFVLFTDQGILAGIRFVLLLTIIKLLSRHRIRDELQIYALAFLMIAAGTAVNEDVTYGVFFGLFVLTGTFSLALFHLKREIGRGDSSTPAWRVPFDRRYMSVLAAISVGIFATSLVIFFGFPRIGLGYFAPDSRGGVSVSGFSEDVELGNHGNIRDNPEVVMRVEFPDGQPANFEQLHWRTLSFDYYDGSGWSKTRNDKRHDVYAYDGWFDLRGIHLSDATSEIGQNNDQDAARPRSMEIYVEPLGSNLLPTLWPTERLQFTVAKGDSPPASPRSGHLEVDNYGDVHHTIRSDLGIPYRIESGDRPTASQLREVDASIPTDAPRLGPYLQTPDRGMDRIRQLAESIINEADRPYEKAEAIESYLLSNYTYTTDLPEMQADNPVVGFLFETERGHCEYYASSMVLMLRSLGIPARMVNGFLGGAWNGVGDYLAVRQQDAHSWVEVYIPNYGFVQMDPTPPGSGVEPNPLVEWARETYDASRMVWMQWVIEYDLENQIEAVKEALDFIDPGAGWSSMASDDSEESEDREGPDIPWRDIVLWSVFALLAFAAGWSSRRHDPREQWPNMVANALFWSVLSSVWLALFVGINLSAALGGLAAGAGGVGAAALGSVFRRYSDAAPPTRLFHRIVRAARHAGVERREGEPPARFLMRLADEYPKLARDLKRFRRRYLAARFGGRTFDRETRRQIEGLVDRICDGIRQ